MFHFFFLSALWILLFNIKLLICLAAIYFVFLKYFFMFFCFFLHNQIVKNHQICFLQTFELSSFLLFPLILISIIFVFDVFISFTICDYHFFHYFFCNFAKKESFFINLLFPFLFFYKIFIFFHKFLSPLCINCFA